MPRPRMNRWIRQEPPVQYYKPQGVPLERLRGMILPLDGLEALRLADAEGLEQERAAEMMGISRPTFSRLLAEARQIVAKSLVNGWAIRIEGGNYAFAGGASPPCDRGRRRCRRGPGGAVRSGAMQGRIDGALSPEPAGAFEEEPAPARPGAFAGPPQHRRPER